jgi:hypothetical protein
MKKISSLVVIIFLMNCTKRISLINPVIDKNQLTGRSIKYWNISPSKTGEIKEECWIFRKNGTFSYYSYLEYKHSRTVKVLEWFGNDIKIGENGIIPWELKSDTIEIAKSKYKILFLNKDSLIVQTPHSAYTPIDTLLFTNCEKCSK